MRQLKTDAVTQKVKLKKSHSSYRLKKYERKADIKAQSKMLQPCLTLVTKVENRDNERKEIVKEILKKNYSKLKKSMKLQIENLYSSDKPYELKVAKLGQLGLQIQISQVQTWL